MRTYFHWILLVASLLATTASAWADSLANDDLRAQALAAAPSSQGWKAGATLGSTFSFNQSQSVVGTADGVAMQLGVLADGQATYTAGQHAWSNALKLNYAESKTPVLDRFVKSADVLEFNTAYTYRLAEIPWIGPYARARLATQMTPSYLVKSTPFGVKWSAADATATPYGAQQFVQVTGAFDPILIGEAVGLFANPTESEAVTVKLKLGLASQQLFTSWGYSVADDTNVAAIQMKALQNATQVGGEAEVLAYGQVSTDLKWKAKALFFMPFYTSIAGTASGIDALNSDFSAGASYKLSKWLSVDYVFSAKHVPLVSDKWQIQNGAVLTAGFNL